MKQKTDTSGQQTIIINPKFRWYFPESVYKVKLLRQSEKSPVTVPVFCGWSWDVQVIVLNLTSCDQHHNFPNHNSTYTHYHTQLYLCPSLCHCLSERWKLWLNMDMWGCLSLIFFDWWKSVMSVTVQEPLYYIFADSMLHLKLNLTTVSLFHQLHLKSDGYHHSQVVQHSQFIRTRAAALYFIVLPLRVWSSHYVECFNSYPFILLVLSLLICSK